MREYMKYFKFKFFNKEVSLEKLHIMALIIHSKRCHSLLCWAGYDVTVCCFSKTMTHPINLSNGQVSCKLSLETYQVTCSLHAKFATQCILILFTCYTKGELERKKINKL